MRRKKALSVQEVFDSPPPPLNISAPIPGPRFYVPSPVLPPYHDHYHCDGPSSLPFIQEVSSPVTKTFTDNPINVFHVNGNSDAENEKRDENRNWCKVTTTAFTDKVNTNVLTSDGYQQNKYNKNNLNVNATSTKHSMQNNSSSKLKSKENGMIKINSTSDSTRRSSLTNNNKNGDLQCNTNNNNNKSKLSVKAVSSNGGSKIKQKSPVRAFADRITNRSDNNGKEKKIPAVTTKASDKIVRPRPRSHSPLRNLCCNKNISNKANVALSATVTTKNQVNSKPKSLLQRFNRILSPSPVRNCTPVTTPIPPVRNVSRQSSISNEKSHKKELSDATREEPSTKFEPNYRAINHKNIGSNRSPSLQQKIQNTINNNQLHGILKTEIAALERDRKPKQVSVRFIPLLFLSFFLQQKTKRSA